MIGPNKRKKESFRNSLSVDEAHRGRECMRGREKHREEVSHKEDLTQTGIDRVSEGRKE